MKDKFGLSWQITPKQLPELMKAGNEKQTTAVSEAMMKMGKLDVEGLRKAFEEAT
jgi:predicted 3-demethylubiquinone-9 3-methyltransferase (glyoxalase superfamily)